MKNSSEIISYLQLPVPPLLEELYGKEKSTLEIQKQRYLRLLDSFTQQFQRENIQFFSSPGRTEIGGNHTDHNYGRVLAGAVDLDNIAIAAANGTSVIHITSLGYPDIVLDITDLEPKASEQFTSVSLVRGICARMKELGFIVGGFDASIDGAVPKGSGLSSSASFEVLVGAFINHLFNDGKLDPIQNALIGQYAENKYFGKPCGLMDQTACSVGGLITIDFKDPSHPIVKKIDFDFQLTGYYLVITDTGGNHADLNEEYASLPIEMKSVAAALGATVLREVSLESIIHAIPELRNITGDRAILRALHFQGDNQRVADQVEALEKNDFGAFLEMVIASGFSSFMYNQNIYPVHNVKEQGVSLALALSEILLKGKGAWRVHGGGFAGTIQAFVPSELLETYTKMMTQVFGENACHKLSIRKQGAIRLNFPEGS
ncbi:MAG: galactokinase [Bacteroidales bacterium]|nr:galactokinase [Bacteroidales bacterium]